MYSTTNNLQMKNFMMDFYESKIILHFFHENYSGVDQGIGYDTIIGYDLMVNLSLIPDFKRNVLGWGGDTIPTKYTYQRPGKPNLYKPDMRQM